MKPEEKLKVIEHQLYKFEILGKGQSVITNENAKWLIDRVKRLSGTLKVIADYETTSWDKIHLINVVASFSRLAQLRLSDAGPEPESKKD